MNHSPADPGFRWTPFVVLLFVALWPTVGVELVQEAQLRLRALKVAQRLEKDGIKLGDKSYAVQIIQKDVESSSDTAASRAGDPSASF